MHISDLRQKQLSSTYTKQLPTMEFVWKPSQTVRETLIVCYQNKRRLIVSDNSTQTMTLLYLHGSLACATRNDKNYHNHNNAFLCFNVHKEPRKLDFGLCITSPRALLYHQDDFCSCIILHTLSIIAE